MRDGDDLVGARWTDALERGRGRDPGGRRPRAAGGVGVLGGARLTNEDAYAWAKLAKGVIGTDNVDAQLGDGLPAELVLGLPGATIDEVCAAGGTVLLLGPDLKEELPVLFLRLRDAVVSHGVRIVELAPHATGITALATVSLFASAGRGRRHRRAALLDGPPPGTDAGGVDPTGLATASHLLDVGPGHRRDRPPVAGRVERRHRRRGRRRCSPRKPDTRFLPVLRRGQRPRRPRHGPRPGLLPGRVTLDAGRDALRQRVGQGAAPSAGSTPPASSRPPPPASSTCWSCSAPTRWPTSPIATSPAAPSPAPAP